jgi:acetoin utilization deacetylase AcuC-like enzyme
VHAFFATQFVLPLPEGHRFPMRKYDMLREGLALHLPQVQLAQAPQATTDELRLVHTADYIDGIDHGTLPASYYREIGFPWSEAMAERARRSVGATLSAARYALSTGVAANLAGGTHHAYADKGGGFCVFNDLAVTARVLQAQAGPGRQAGQGPLQVAVIDLDVHQGNGTAHICRSDPDVFTLSIHGEKNFPFRKEASDFDIGLPDGCGDDDYLATLDGALERLDGWFRPELVLYLAGADPHEGDRLGRLKLTTAGLMERDRRVFDWCWQRRLPCAFVMGGGYGHDLHQTVAVQLNTYRVALDYWQHWQQNA